MKSIFPWWSYCVALLGISLALSLHTASFSYTDLDDTIFIREFENFNRQDTAYAKSFKRGVFNDSNDTYFRPFLLSSFVFDRHREGRLNMLLHVEDQTNDSIAAYHWTNIVAYVLSVLLLFFVFRNLKCSNNLSFILSGLFAVHPVLVQAVGWIPGRNDSILAVFVFAFLINAIVYMRTQQPLLLVTQMLLLLGAMFSKETGLIAAPMCLLVLMVLHRVSWKDKHLWLASLSWLLAILVWLFIRSTATVKNQDIGFTALLANFIERTPLILQYLGKILLPINLAVVPYQDQTSIIPGLISLLIIAALLFFSREKDWRSWSVGIAWYLIFLLPVLVVPKTLNNEAYEHRLYLPLVGILLLLGTTDLVRRFSEMKVIIASSILCVALFVMSYSRSELFSDRIKFWESAVSTAPQSAYCNMMLGARYVMDKVHPRRPEGEALIRKAYAIDSSQKYLNYYMGKILWDHDSVAQSEAYFRRELALNPQWAELYFRLARCVIERKQLEEGIGLLKKHYEINPTDKQGVNNLLMVYVEAGRWSEARDFYRRVQRDGQTVQKELVAHIDEGFAKDSVARASKN